MTYTQSMKFNKIDFFISFIYQNIMRFFYFLVINIINSKYNNKIWQIAHFIIYV